MKIRGRSVRLIAVLLAVMLSAFSFSGTSAENVLTWPAGVPVVGEQMFYGDTSIETVVLPEGVTGIASKAFAESSLKEIYLPSTLDVTNIEEAFDNTIRRFIDICPAVHAPVGSDAYNWARETGLQAEFRALLIGEKTFYRGPDDIETAKRNVNDASKMDKMLKSVFGYTGDPYRISVGIDYSYEAIHAAIEETFAGAREQDISLFFIATHGNSSGDLEMPYFGPILSKYENNEEGYNQYLEDYNNYIRSWKRNLTIDVLAGWLSNVPGRVIVILESCYAGMAIYDPDIAENSLKNASVLNAVKTESQESISTEDGGLFAKQAVQAFAEKDPGIRVKQIPSSGKKLRSGELRQPKFYVLAASRHDEESWGDANGVQDPMNLFTRWLIQGIGSKTKSPADSAPKDGMLTLKELFLYVKAKSDIPVLYDHGNPVYQHIQCYPGDCEFVCFLIK